MKYTCDCINSLFFDYNCVKCGCSNTGGVVYIPKFDGTNFDIEKINKIKNSIASDFDKGIVPDVCKNCYMLHECESEETIILPKTLDSIYISHWLHCNCGCVYCCNVLITNLKITPNAQKSEYYQLLPVIKFLTKEGYIGSNTEIFTIGGEPTVLDEFDEIIDELGKYSQGKTIFLSSGINYSETIYNFLKRNNTELFISLDCGTREMYKKIKRVDAFNQVVDNIKKYVTANPDNEKSVSLKYILVQGLNDNISEIAEFLNVAKSTGVQSVYLDVNHDSRQKTRQIPNHWVDLFQFFQSANGAHIHGYCQQILDKRNVF